MNTNNILSAPLIDIVFDGRNKDYGAYLLRKTYSKRLLISLFITSIMVGLVFAGAAIARNSRKPENNYIIKSGHIIRDIPPIKENKPEKPKPKEKTPDAVKTRIFTEPKLTDQQIERPVPDVEDLSDALVGDQNLEGKPDEGLETGPEKPGNGSEIIPDKPEKEDDIPLTTVEIPAKFNGNWVKFLLRYLNPEVPVENDAPAGTYSVIIQFVVDKEGNVSEVKALTNHGYGVEEEAIRVIKKAGKWEPAIQNGYKVKAFHRQVITFNVVGEE